VAGAHGYVSVLEHSATDPDSGTQSISWTSRLRTSRFQTFYHSDESEKVPIGVRLFKESFECDIDIDIQVRDLEASS
jgi:hypothetical protein